MKKLLTVASLIALMTLPSMAQETTIPKTPPGAQLEKPSDRAPAAVSSAELSARALLSESILNGLNERIGDINDVALSKDGRVAAVIVGVGGFLGMGEKNVALSFDQLAFAHDNVGGLVVTTSATKESLQAAPEWKPPEDRQ